METKRNEGGREKDGEGIQIGRKSLVEKGFDENRRCGPWSGYKTIEKRLIPEEDHRMKSDITRGARSLIQPNCSFMRIFEIFMKLYENFFILSDSRRSFSTVFLQERYFLDGGQIQSFEWQEKKRETIDGNNGELDFLSKLL